MSLFWPGPGRALQGHLEMFARVDQARSWVAAHQGRVVPDSELEAAPRLFRQRLRLMTTMGDNVGIVDGHSLTDLDHPHQAHTVRNVQRACGLINTEHELLDRGETHYLSHHILTSIAAAAEASDDEPLFPTDLPCPNGLLVFEYPFIIPDLHPTTGAVVPELRMPVRAIGWSAQQVHAVEDGEMVPHDGIFYSVYTDLEAWDALFVTSVREHLPEEYAMFREVYDNPDIDPMWCIDNSGWAFGKSWRRSPLDQPRDAFESGEIHSTVATVRRLLLAIFRFEWQRILVPETYRPSRAEHRRALRAGMKLEDGYVKVLRLRRHVEAEARGEQPPTGDQLAYDHQWMVRGHPRRQWFPSLGPARNPDGSWNPDSHRQIWIEPFTKGNPYAPLVVGHDVTAVVR